LPPGDVSRSPRAPSDLGSPIALGGLRLENCLMAAPMAGVSDRTFRRLVRASGCALAFPEMVSDKALLFGNQKTLDIAAPYPGEDPFVLQLLGSEPDTLARAALDVVERFGARLIDINMGCPVPKVVRNGEGAALLRRPPLCGAIIERVSRALRSTGAGVSCKLRLGWDEKNGPELVRVVAEAGAAFVSVHARLRVDSYSTPADWDSLAEVVAASPVPVIGNGDVLNPGDALRMFLSTGSTAVMIGRGCQGNPWIFERSLKLALTGDPGPEPSPAERVEGALRHLRLAAADKGERSAVLEMRRHGSWYIKGLPGASTMRDRIMRTGTAAELERLFSDWLEHLRASAGPPAPPSPGGRDPGRS